MTAPASGPRFAHWLGVLSGLVLLVLALAWSVPTGTGQVGRWWVALLSPDYGSGSEALAKLQLLRLDAAAAGGVLLVVAGFRFWLARRRAVDRDRPGLSRSLNGGLWLVAVIGLGMTTINLLQVQYVVAFEVAGRSADQVRDGAFHGACSFAARARTAIPADASIELQSRRGGEAVSYYLLPRRIYWDARARNLIESRDIKWLARFGLGAGDYAGPIGDDR